MFDFQTVEIRIGNKTKEVLQCKNCEANIINRTKSRLENHQKNVCPQRKSLVNNVPEDNFVSTLTNINPAPDTSTPQTSGIKVVNRQSTMTSFADKVEKCESNILIDALARFFFVCRIPFNVVSNFFFRTMIFAFRPAFKKYMPSRKALGSTLLDRHYEMCLERDTKNIPSRCVLLLDGWKIKFQTRKTWHLCYLTPWKGNHFSSIPTLWREMKRRTPKICIIWYNHLQIINRNPKFLKKLFFQQTLRILEYIKEKYKTQIKTFVSDNCNTMIALGEKLRHILWRSGCNAHIGNLLAGDVINKDVCNKLRDIQKLFKQTKFETLVKEKGGHRVKLGSATRWCYYRYI